jgi:chaperonin GroEL (HSP60 family)
MTDGRNGALRDDTAGDDRDTALQTNLAAARGLADVVRTTLGPRGMDKMLVGDGRIVVTNDGASILDRIEIDHPTAEFVLGVAESQEENAFDGTTTAVVLAAAFLERGVELVERGLHPTTVVRGYDRAAAAAVERLTALATPVEADDRDLLAAVARTAVTGKWDEAARTAMAELAADVAADAYRDGRVWRRRISIVAAAGGTVHDAERHAGLVVDTAASSTAPTSLLPPEPVANATVALVDGAFTVQKPDAVGSVSPTTADELAEFHAYEAATYRSKADRLAELGVDVVFCQQSVDDRARGVLEAAGILPVERTRRDELFKLARATSARPVAAVDELVRGDLGLTERLDHRTLGGTDYLFLTGNPRATQTTLVLRGETDRIAGETADAFRDCLNAAVVALEGEGVVPGAGAGELAAARSVEAAAEGIAGRERLAADAFADALTVVPRTLVTTAGADPLDVLPVLRRRHADGDHAVGFDATAGAVADAAEAGVVDPLGVKTGAVESATEAVRGLLRVDGIVDLESPLGGGEEHDHDHDHETGPGGLRADTDGYPWAVGH